MDSMESCVPPGFRFHPTDEELVGYYLKKKVASQKIDLDVIRDIDLYRIEPWDLQERCKIGYEEQTEWYFFSHKDKKYPTGTRTNRATLAGFWKATGRDKAVRDKNKLIGMRKTLVFYKGRAPNGQKTDWITHEYRLESEENAPPQEEGWVVCRAFKKRTACQQPRTLVVDPWDSSPCLPNPLDYLYSQPHPPQKNLFCKQETELDALNLLHSAGTAFIQLPQLESPSLLPVRRLSSVEQEEDDQQVRVTDWRALDKFVASQLSHDQDCSTSRPDPEVEPIAGFDSDSGEMVALLMLQEEGRNGEQGGLLSSEGTCVFDKCA